jgi:hypothetical protein
MQRGDALIADCLPPKPVDKDLDSALADLARLLEEE